MWVVANVVAGKGDEAPKREMAIGCHDSQNLAATKVAYLRASGNDARRVARDGWFHVARAFDVDGADLVVEDNCQRYVRKERNQT